MDELGVRGENIILLLENLYSKNALLREDSFGSLRLYFDSPDIELIFNFLLRRADTQSLYWLIRYLVAVGSSLAYAKILLLLGNQNQAIRQEAASALVKIEPDQRADLLIRMLSFPWKEEVCFAAGELGKLRLNKATIPLLEALKKYGDDEEVCLCIIEALGLIRDLRAFGPLERLAKKSKGRQQEEALAALSRFAARLNYRFLVKLVDSENLNIRKIAYQVAARSGLISREKILSLGLLRETDQNLKLLILGGITSIGSKRLFEVIFRISCQKDDFEFSALGESVIRRNKSRRAFKWLLAVEKISPDPERAAALRYLSDYQEERRVFEVLRARYLYQQRGAVRLTAIECLGKLKDDRCPGFLRDVVKANNEFSFSAAFSLINFVESAGFSFIEDTFTFPGAGPTLLDKAFLYFLLNLPQGNELAGNIERRICDYLKADSWQLRYLAIRCLGKSLKKESIARILEIIRLDDNPMVRKACLKSLRDILSRDPSKIAAVLDNFLHDDHMFYAVYRILERIEVRQPFLPQIIVMILENIRRRKNRSEHQALRLSRMILLLRVLAQRNKSAILEYLAGRDPDDPARWALMKAINLTEIHRSENLNVGFMARQYALSSSETKAEYLVFFKKLDFPDDPLKREIFRQFAKEQDREVRESSRELISSWLNKSLAGS